MQKQKAKARAKKNTRYPVQTKQNTGRRSSGRQYRHDATKISTSPVPVTYVRGNSFRTWYIIATTHHHQSHIHTTNHQPHTYVLYDQPPITTKHKITPSDTNLPIIHQSRNTRPTTTQPHDQSHTIRTTTTRSPPNNVLHHQSPTTANHQSPEGSWAGYLRGAP